MHSHIAETLALAQRGALFVVNHSGGKDSQAMLLHIAQLVPVEQIVVIHAELPEVEWDGTEAHMRDTSLAAGIAAKDIFVVRARKTFFDMVSHRGWFPTPKNRQCTSDLKRNPIHVKIREIAAARNVRLIVSCEGLRAEESSARAAKATFKPNKSLSVAGREVYDLLPIHSWSTAEVFDTIARAGQKPHWAYEAGMTRLSCCFCIMSSASDFATAARLNPTLLARYAKVERQIGRTVRQKKVDGQFRFIDEDFAIA